ncbi:protein translocase subunit SecDF [Slackia faecicanis]|uniref:Multifunctional fusion protein n=2 Tax=Eggerthellaceae TaxID=1643826 RepID=A0A3N0AF32_9ACTN|nr:protein translocase subunit SecD [Slackia faecicanis]MDO5358181.1 protein translocase subunit SecD [Slackia faecicanis]RNL19848.1 protein translocase subunit SecDF [Slackia faecicanis]
MKPSNPGSSSSSKKRRKTSQHVNRRNVWLLIVTTLLVVGSVFMFTPPQEKINQGLDIQGGLSVVLTAKGEDGAAVSAEDMEKSRAIIESRVNSLGASEATVALQSTDQVLVQIPGLSDTEEALATIGKTGKLEFARLDSFTDEAVRTKIETGQYMEQESVTDAMGNRFPTSEQKLTLHVDEGTYTPIVTGDDIERVTVGQASEASTDYAVNLKLDSEGASAFAQATKELAPTKGQIVIILDGVVQSAPAVQGEIPNGDVSITGGYTLDEAKSMQTVLESGSLPVSFEFAQSQTVGPTLGQDALASGVLVAGIGLALVMLYLLLFYHGLGFITAAAMAVFAALYLGILATLSHFGLFSLSLAGIAGIVLTIGMAADSSILTLERFREEIRMGRSVRAASKTGVRHGIMTSIDADLVTLVSALTLFLLASASVKGFGLTLALGILCDIAMMLLFKAPLIRLLAPRAIAKHPGFWGVSDSQNAAPYFDGEKQLAEGEKLRGRFIKRDFDILGLRKYFLTAACIVVAAIAIIVGVRGINFGIEFIGGTSIAFHDTGDVSIEQVRDAFGEAGEPDAVVQTTVTDGEEGFLVRTTSTSAEDATAVANDVADTFGWSTSGFEVTTIGPDWGASVIQSSILAFVVSLVLIIGYISIRFRDYKMGVTAVVALLHDLVIVFGVYAILGHEVTPNTIAALLTILGYSLYDTVVVFHRINENMKSDSVKCTFMSMANHSVNEVLIRSLNTSITSLIPVVAMLLFGGETLKDFALAMTIGLVTGCYSSIAIATPLYAIWKTREDRFAKLQKKYGTGVQRFFLNKLPMAAKAEAAASEHGQAVVAEGATQAAETGETNHKKKGK